MRREPEPMRCEYRSAEDDFFCDKYQVWYPVRDCNYRVLHRTFEGCIDCFQGRVNLRRLRRGMPLRIERSGDGTLLSFPEPAVPEDLPRAADPEG